MSTDRFCFPKTGCRVIVAGSSGCGKSEFVKRVIINREQLFETIPERIVWIYKFAQPFFTELPFIEFSEVVPSHFEANTSTLIIADDLISDVNALKQISDLFIRGRHAGVSVILLTQNLFFNNADYRLLSLNASHFVLFKSVRGAHQIRSLGYQIYSKKESIQFIEAYLDATKAAYGYLVLDLTPSQTYRLRTRIFPEETELVYLIE